MTDPRITKEMIEAGARAAAILGDYDGCFERIDEWNALEQWEREAHPENEPFMDYEDAEFWRKRTAAALEAVFALLPEPEWEYSVGYVNHDGRVLADDEEDPTPYIDEAREWVKEALDSGSFSNAILVRQRKSEGWEPVPDTNEGEKRL